MKRIFIIIVALVGIGGLIALMNYKPASTASTGGSLGATAQATPSVTPGAVPTGVAYKDGTYSGSTIDVGYGPVQVAAVIAGGKLTNVQFLQMPSDRDRSVQIANEAEPILLNEAITAQSAQVDSVSGATATSDGFTQSLSTALSKATTTS